MIAFAFGLVIGFLLGWFIRPFTGKIIKGANEAVDSAKKDLKTT